MFDENEITEITSYCVGLLEYDAARSYIDSVMLKTYAEWYATLEQARRMQALITSANIPQFSDFNDGIINVITIIRQMGDFGPGYEQIGKYLLGKGKKPIAYLKYGENHAKLAQQLGLLKTKKEGRHVTIYLSEVGKIYEALPEDEKMKYIKKQVLKIPIIHELTFNKKDINIFEELSLYLAESTARRRTSNVKKIMELVEDTYREI
jgi:hypothetical protein